jgi:hypothetical protein
MPWGASPPYIPPKNNNFLKFLKVLDYQSLNTIYWTKQIILKSFIFYILPAHPKISLPLKTFASFNTIEKSI